MNAQYVESRFVRRVFSLAAIYGVLVLAPQYFLESRLVPPTNYPEQFYGFVGVALAWQFVFWLISRDVVKYRALMPVAFMEKLAFAAPAVVLFISERVQWPVLVFGLIDLSFGVMFIVAFMRIPPVRKVNA